MGVELAEGNVKNYESVLEAVRGMDHVYHCAAVVGMGIAPRSEYYAVNAEGTKNVVRACEAAGVKRLVHISTQSVTFDFTEKRNADENEPFPLRYKDPYSESKAWGEKAVTEAGKTGNLQTVAIRPTLVWGPGDKLVLPVMAKLASRNQLFLINKGQVEMSTSHVENVCECMLLAAQRENVSGEAFLVTDDERITAREFAEKMADAAGFEKPKKSIPYGLAFAYGTLVEKFHALPWVNTPPVMSRYAVALSGLDLSFNCEKARRMLGYRPVVSISEGMRRLAHWLEEIGGIESLLRS